MNSKPMGVRLKEADRIRFIRISAAMYERPATLAAKILREWMDSRKVAGVVTGNASATNGLKLEAEKDTPLYLRGRAPGRRVFIAADPPATERATPTRGRGGSGR